MKAVIFSASVLALSTLPHPAPAAPTFVDGGVAKHVYTAATADFQAGTLAYAPLAGAVRTINVPAGGDTIVVTFTAECVLKGSTDPEANWVEVLITDNAVPILPTNVGADPLAMCSNENFTSAPVTAVKRLAPGSHTIRVSFKINKGNDDSLTAFLDDWSFVIEQFE